MRYHLTIAVVTAIGAATWAGFALRDWHARIIANAGKDPLRWDE